MSKQFSLVAKRTLVCACGIFPVTLAPLITATIGWRPLLGAKMRPLADRHFAPTLQRLERGRYLVEAVAGCFDCHSEAADELKAGEPPVFTGRVVTSRGGLVLVAPNITPDVETGAGAWTDDQLARAIREGISHDGRTLYPMMPYQEFRYLSDEDLASIIVYIRSIATVRNKSPKSRIPFPLSRLINTAPQPLAAPVVVDFSDAISRGLYLTEIASCAYCHTPAESLDHPLPGAIRRWEAD